MWSSVWEWGFALFESQPVGSGGNGNPSLLLCFSLIACRTDDFLHLSLSFPKKKKKEKKNTNTNTLSLSLSLYTKIAFESKAVIISFVFQAWRKDPVAWRVDSVARWIPAIGSGVSSLPLCLSKYEPASGLMTQMVPWFCKFLRFGTYFINYASFIVSKIGDWELNG